MEPHQRVAATTSKRRGPRRCRRSPYALATAIGVLDGVRASGKIDEDELPQWSAHQLLRERQRPLRGGDLQNAGLHPAVGPHCRERYGVEDPKLRRFRYGVQVNSLG